MSKVSVIIPTFNRAPYISAAIESVLSQSHIGWEKEIIVVDDGSTDNTSELVAVFKDKVTYIQIAHSGKPATARNVGIKYSTGTVIAFLDSDDLWSKDKLSIQLPYFNDPRIVFSYGGAKLMLEDGTTTNQMVVDTKKFPKKSPFSSLLKENYISTLTTMVRRSALDSVGLFDEDSNLRAVEDYELWLRITAKYPAGIKSSTSTLAYYRKHENNISSADNSLALTRLNHVYRSIWSNHLSHVQKKDLEQAILQCSISLSRAQNEEHPSSKPLISVIMSVYNGGNYLFESIESILNQTIKNIEFIIIDDGSSDDSVKTVEHYNDPRIRLILQTNHGLVTSLNKALDISRGTYIARQDADDVSLPSRLEKELQLMMGNQNLGVVGTFFTYLSEDSLTTSTTIAPPFKNIDIKRSLYFTNPFGHGTTMMRKSIFSNIGAYTSTYGPTEDFELWRRVADKWEFGIVPESLYLYRLNSEGISHKKSSLQHTYTAKIVAEQWDKPFIHKPLKDIINDGRDYLHHNSTFSIHIYNQYVSQQIDIARTLLNRGDIKTGIKTAIGTMFLKPKSITYFLKPGLIGIRHRLKTRRKI